MFVAPVFAQDGDNGRLAKGLQYGLEMQASLSEGKTPLWMNANKYGLSSLEESNGYMPTCDGRRFCYPLAARSGLWN